MEGAASERFSDSTGAVLTGTGTLGFMVSDSGNRDTILTSFSTVTSFFFVAAA